MTRRRLEGRRLVLVEREDIGYDQVRLQVFSVPRDPRIWGRKIGVPMTISGSPRDPGFRTARSLCVKEAARMALEQAAELDAWDTLHGTEKYEAGGGELVGGSVCEWEDA